MPNISEALSSLSYSSLFRKLIFWDIENLPSSSFSLHKQKEKEGGGSGGRKKEKEEIKVKTKTHTLRNHCEQPQVNELANFKSLTKVSLHHPHPAE